MSLALFTPDRQKPVFAVCGCWDNWRQLSDQYVIWPKKCQVPGICQQFQQQKLPQTSISELSAPASCLMGWMLGCSQWASNVLCHFTSADGQQYYCMMVLMVSNCTYTGISCILMTKWSVFFTLFLYSELPVKGTELHWICTEWTVAIVSTCALLATVPWPSSLSLKAIWQHRWAPMGSYHQDLIKVTHETDVSLEEMYRFINL